MGGFMKCIKKRCRYCSEHEFRSSYLQCELDGWGGFLVTSSNKECKIDEFIEWKRKGLEEIEKYRNKILTRQD